MIGKSLLLRMRLRVALHVSDPRQFGTRSMLVKAFQRFLDCRSGATAIEYALIAVLVGVGLIAALLSMGTGITSAYQTVVDGFDRVR